MHITSSENVKGRHQLGKFGVDGRIIYKMYLKKHGAIIQKKWKQESQQTTAQSE
jgi:hypothetical protein